MSKIIMLIILLILINVYSPELMPNMQAGANSHNGLPDRIWMLYNILAIVLLVFCIIDYRRHKGIFQLLLYVATIASLVFWADQFISIDCINCSSA
jgi:hypothetical protein